MPEAKEKAEMTNDQASPLPLSPLPQGASSVPSPRCEACLPGTTPDPGKYIYCIIDSDVPELFGPIGVGGQGSEVRTIGLNGVGAVVSDSPVKEYRQDRENMLAHERAIEMAMKTHTVLPAAFSTIAEDETMVTRILVREHDRFVELLTGIKGKMEAGLKAIFEESAVCRRIIEKYGPIRELKAKIAHLPPQRSYYQRIEIGRMVESALKQERESIREEIISALTPLAVDVVTNLAWNDRMILNGAFLIEQQRAGDFDQQVEQLAAKYGDQVQFKLVGTVPPFNFVKLAIDTRDYRNVPA